MTYERVIRNIPRAGELLAKYGGMEVIDRIGHDAVKDVVTSVLCGGNVRSLTEGLTRRRLALSNAELLVTFLKSNREIENFAQNIPHIVKAGLDSRLSNERKLFLKWCIGLTEKGIQNVLRGKGDEFGNYLDVLEKSIGEAARQCNVEYGDLEGVLRIHGVESRVD